MGTSDEADGVAATGGQRGAAPPHLPPYGTTAIVADWSPGLALRNPHTFLQLFRSNT